VVALQIIAYRALQAVGGALLMANSAAILSEAFPPQERGFALGLNGVIGIFGGVAGIVVGGILASIYWRDVFLVNIPVGVIGTVWSIKSLKALSKPDRSQRLDLAGNILFAAALILILVGITYGILPYGTHPTGWSNPYVRASIVGGAGVLACFLYVESKVANPMFRLELFRSKAFSAASAAIIFAQLAFGGLQLMLVLFLQAVWLPLHGYSYEVTPFWSGIYLLPLLVGFGLAGSVSGRLADRRGARLPATAGLIVMCVGLLLLAALPYDFGYPEFPAIIALIGVGNGLFVSPNTAALMNAAPPKHRGSASGIRAMLTNTGNTLSTRDILHRRDPSAQRHPTCDAWSGARGGGRPTASALCGEDTPDGRNICGLLGLQPSGHNTLQAARPAAAPLQHVLRDNVQHVVSAHGGARTHSCLRFGLPFGGGHSGRGGRCFSA